jgi:nitrite reductase/ring-hydroxylating ferredoxin subunit
LIRLCHVSAFHTHRSRGFQIQSTKLFVVTKDAAYFGYLNNCPHQHSSLNWKDDQFLDDDAELIRCASHDALFEIESGRCLSGPCIGASLQPFDVNVIDGYLCISDETLRAFQQQ